MSHWMIALSAVCLMGCAAQDITPENSQGLDPAPTAESEKSTAQDQHSEVLGKQDSKVKCPKNSKLINGKCLLQVESND